MMDSSNWTQPHSGSVTHIDQPIIIPVTVKKKKMKSSDCGHTDIVDDDAIRYFDDELAAIAVTKENETVLGCSPSTSKVVLGLVIVICIAFSWTGSTQFAKETYSAEFNAPYFTTWFSTCFMVIVYPVFMIPLMCQKSPWRLRTFLRQTAMIFGPRGFCLNSLLVYLSKIIVPFCVIWLLTNYLYLRSLNKLYPGTVTAVFSSASCFVYIFSLVFLKEKLFLSRIAAMFLSVGGIVLMGYSEGFDDSSNLSIVFVVLAALGAALYQVLFKVVLGDASGAQVALFLTLVGCVNILLFWPIILFMCYQQYETIHWNDMPWKFLTGTASLGVVFNYLVNFGISLTFPLFISVGTLLGVPLNAITDAIFRHESFGKWQIISTLLIFCGFFLMLVTNETLERFERRSECCKNKNHGYQVGSTEAT